MTNRNFPESDYNNPEVMQALSRKIHDFKIVKQNFIAAFEIAKQKKDSGNQIEADEWSRKANDYWLKLTEILARDWGYDLDTFRELWKLKNPNYHEVGLKIQNYSSITDGSNFFDLFGTKSNKSNKSESKSLLQSIVDFFSN